MTRDSVRTALEWCGSRQIDCLYFLAAADDRETVTAAESAGFELVDVRVTLVRAVADKRTGVELYPDIRPFAETDLARLKMIARQSHRDSRFFFDGRFPEERCEALFERWIERSCEGWAQAVFVPEVEGMASGYCTCHIDGKAGSIGLVALAQNAQGKGLGGLLISAALDYFHTQGVARVTVVTQGRNVRAQRLYQRSGFVTDSILLWYHKWFD